VKNSWPNDRNDFDRNLAVIIGIDDYKGTRISKLSTPVSDATALADLLQGKFGYDNVWRLINADASLAGLKTLFNETLPHELKPTESDRLIVYFAGHGVPKNSDEGPTGYLVPQDARSGEEKTFLPMKEVWEALEKLECHHLLIILDCCFSGQFRWASSRKLTVVWDKIHREHYDRFIRYPAWQVITSSAHDQEALDQVKLTQDSRGIEGDTKHSPFALALLEALGDGYTDDEGKNLSADYTKDGVITSQELIVYLEERLAKLSNSRQVPGLYPLDRKYDKGQFIFVEPGFDPSETLTPAPELNPENNPYRGLNSFEERHANFFFGREKLIDELRDRLVNSPNNFPLIAVLGVSGSGKSSLVKAGLVPKLREQSEKGKWYILEPMRPGLLPFAELAKVFLPIINPELLTDLNQVSFLDEKMKIILDTKSEINKDLDNGKSVRADNSEQSLEQKNIDIKQLAKKWCSATNEAKLLLILDYYEKLKNFCQDSSEKQESEKLFALHQNITETLESVINKIQAKSEFLKEKIVEWIESHPETKILLVVDQFEELITLDQSDSKTNQSGSDSEQSEGQKFLEYLKVILQECSQDLRVVVTLRSDFEPRFINSPLKDYWNDARFPVRAMNSDELREAIAGPAEREALNFQPDELVGQLVDEVGQMPGALPLLSFTLSELYIKLYERNKAGGLDRALKEKDYNALGGVAGALTRRATEEYENLLTESGEVYQATMRRLMLRMVSLEGGMIARRRVLDSELVYVDDAENDRVNTIKDRLVTARLLVKGEENKVSYVEPAHDFLVRGWDKLQKWIRDEQENLLLQKRLTGSTFDWRDQTDRDDPKFLWKQDPRIELLENITKSENNWLNKLEIEFLGACLKFRDLQERGKLEKEIELYTELSLRIFIGNDRLDAIVKMIEAGKLLQKGLKITEYKELHFIILFNQLLSECGELNSIDTGKPVRKFSCNQKAQVIVTVTVSKNRDKIRFWDWQGKSINFEEEEEKDDEAFYDLAFSPDGKTLVTGGNDGLIKFYRKEDNGWHSFYKTQGDNQKHDFKVNCVNFSPDGNILVTTAGDRKINLWDREGHFIMNLTTHLYPVEQIALSPKDNLIAFIDAPQNQDIKKGVIRIWEYPACPSTGNSNSLFEWDTGHTIGISAIDFSPDGESLVSGGWDGELKIWRISKDLNETELFASGEDEASISYVAFSPDGKIVASSHTNGIINLWNTEITNVSNVLQRLYRLAGHKEAISKISFTSDGSQLLSGSIDGTVKLWSFQDRFEGHLEQNSVGKISFSADNQIVTTIDEGGNVRLWRSNGELLKKFNNDASKICDAQLNQDNKIVVAVGSDGEVMLYGLDGTILYRSIDNHKQAINILSRSPIEDIFVTASDNTIGLWKLNQDPLNGLYNVELLKMLTEHQKEITAITFSADGQFFASGSDDGTVKIWNLDANQALKTISDVGGSIVNLSLRDDGKMIGVSLITDKYEIEVCICTLSDDSIKFLDRKTTAMIYASRFYYEDTALALINDDGCIEIWSVDGTLWETISALNEQALHKNVESAVFSSNGEEIALAICLDNEISSCYRRIQTLNLNLDTLIKTACKRIQNYLELKNIKFVDE
jgi:WD40 repeat protein